MRVDEKCGPCRLDCLAGTRARLIGWLAGSFRALRAHRGQFVHCRSASFLPAPALAGSPPEATNIWIGDERSTSSLHKVRDPASCAGQLPANHTLPYCPMCGWYLPDPVVESCRIVELIIGGMTCCCWTRPSSGPL